jgi:hypothetical protein
MNSDAWNSHQWASVRGRAIELEPGKPIIQRHCSRCLRDFVEEQSSGERYAVHVSVFTLRRLPAHISSYWLGELCPGAPLDTDLEIRSKLTQSFPTTGNRGA